MRVTGGSWVPVKASNPSLRVHLQGPFFVKEMLYFLESASHPCSIDVPTACHLCAISMPELVILLSFAPSAAAVWHSNRV